jgi:hypothetical protein
MINHRIDREFLQHCADDLHLLTSLEYRKLDACSANPESLIA